MCEKNSIFGRNYLVDKSAINYDIKLEKGWAANFLKAAKRLGEEYELAVFDLGLELRAICTTASLPHYLIDHVLVFYRSNMEASKKPTDTANLARKITLGLSNEIKNSGVPDLSEAQMQAIQSWCAATAIDMVGIEDTDFSEILGDKAWEEFIEDKSFQIAAYGSQRVSYVAIYNAYESFLTRCAEIKNGPKKNPKKRPRVSDALESAFGIKIREACWEPSSINIARVARHALSHNGGRMTDDLRKAAEGSDYDFHTTGDDNLICIWPKDCVILIRSVEKSSLFLLITRTNKTSGCHCRTSVSALPTAFKNLRRLA